MLFLQQSPMQARWLHIDGAPSLSGASAVAIVELLWSMADAIDREYAAEIAGYRCQGQPVRTSWLPPSDEEQLLLVLGDNDYF